MKEFDTYCNLIQTVRSFYLGAPLDSTIGVDDTSLWISGYGSFKIPTLDQMESWLRTKEVYLSCKKVLAGVDTLTPYEGYRYSINAHTLGEQYERTKVYKTLEEARKRAITKGLVMLERYKYHPEDLPQKHPF